MSKALNDVINKDHNAEVCQSNCKENGKVFNHKPHHCHFYKGYASYDSLLRKKTIDDNDYPDSQQIRDEQSTEDLLDFVDKCETYLDMKNEVKLGCRNLSDIIGLEPYIGET